eukprot:Rmarinus@m.29185
MGFRTFLVKSLSASLLDRLQFLQPQVPLDPRPARKGGLLAARLLQAVPRSGVGEVRRSEQDGMIAPRWIRFPSPPSMAPALVCRHGSGEKTCAPGQKMAMRCEFRTRTNITECDPPVLHMAGVALFVPSIHLRPLHRLLVAIPIHIRKTTFEETHEPMCSTRANLIIGTGTARSPGILHHHRLKATGSILQDSLGLKTPLRVDTPALGAEVKVIIPKNGLTLKVASI